MISKRERLKRFEFLKFIPSTILHPFIIQFDPKIRGLKTAEPLCKCRQRNIKNLTMHFYGHTLSDIPKRTRNTKQDACSPLHPLSLRNDKFKHQRERERRREREKCCLTCKNNVGISRTFFSIQIAIKTSIPLLFLTRRVYSR